MEMKKRQRDKRDQGNKIALLSLIEMNNYEI